MGQQRFETVTRRMRRKIVIQPKANFERSILKIAPVVMALELYLILLYVILTLVVQ